MRKNDFILGIAIVIIALVFVFGRSMVLKGTGEAFVYQDSDLIMRIPLAPDRTYDVYTQTEYFGRGFNHVVVSEGRIAVDEADCPDGLCVAQGSIGSVGESIICLPHHLVIKIDKGAESSVDGVSGR